MATAGIRSVGELVRPNRVVDHIGHALSLDPLCADLITGPSQPRYDARSVMDDLCWLSSVGLASSEVLDFSERLIGWLGMKERGSRSKTSRAHGAIGGASLRSQSHFGPP